MRDCSILSSITLWVPPTKHSWLKPYVLEWMKELDLIHNAKAGSGTSGNAAAMQAQANLLALTAHEEKILDKQNTEYLG